MTITTIAQSTPEPREVLEATQACSFDLQDNTDILHIVSGYCVSDAKGEKKPQHYVSLEQDLNGLLTVYPPLDTVGSTDFISYQDSFVECWSLAQFCLAADCECLSIL